MGEKWSQLHHYYMNSSDWQINNATAWNYALQIDESNPDNSFAFQKNKIGPVPFAYWSPPVFGFFFICLSVI